MQPYEGTRYRHPTKSRTGDESWQAPSQATSDRSGQRRARCIPSSVSAAPMATGASRRGQRAGRACRRAGRPRHHGRGGPGREGGEEKTAPRLLWRRDLRGTPKPVSRRTGEARPRGRRPRREVGDRRGRIPHLGWQGLSLADRGPARRYAAGLVSGRGAAPAMRGAGASSATPRQGSPTGAIGAGLRSTSSRECPGWHGDAGTRGNPGHESPTRHGRGLGSAARTWARRQAGYPENYDEDEGAGIGAHLGERRQTSRVRRSPTPRRPRMGEIEGGDESPWPTIGASVGPGTTVEAGRDPLAGHARRYDPN